MKRPAFTLFEVLIAIIFLAAISGALVAVVWRTVESRERMSRTVEATTGLSMLLERIETDLFTCLAGQGESGIAGSADSLLIRSRAVSLVATEGAPPDLQGAEYRLSGNTIEARRWSGEAATGSFDPISVGVARLRFRYHDGKNWKESFDSSRAGGLPIAIEVAVWLKGAEPAEAADEPSDPDEILWPSPDRLRTIAVPDGPITGSRALP